MIKEICAIKHAPVFQLRELLPLLKVVDLKALVENHGFYPAQRRKDVYVNTLLGVFSDAFTVEVLLANMPQAEWDAFLPILNAGILYDPDIEMEDICYAQQVGLLYVFEENTRNVFLVPDDIRGVYSKADHGHMEAYRSMIEVLDLYACAAVNLYGVVESQLLAEIVRAYEGDDSELQFSSDRLESLLHTRAQFEDWYHITGNCFVNKFLSKPNGEPDITDAIRILQRRVGKPRYAPRLEVFLPYANPMFYEQTPPIRRLRKELATYGVGKKTIDDILNELHFLILDEADFSQQLAVVEKYDIRLTMEKINTIVGLITEMNNDTRLWQNFGHTPKELVAMASPEDRMPKSMHIGPNMSKMLQSGEMDITEMWESMQEADFPNPELQASYLSEIKRIANEMGVSLPPAGKVLEFQPRQQVRTIQKSPKIGRNDPCPCGSGKKYKNCCGKNKND